MLGLHPIDPFRVRRSSGRASLLVVLAAADDRESEPIIVREKSQRLADHGCPLQRREAAEKDDSDAIAHGPHRRIEPVARGPDGDDDGTRAGGRTHAVAVLGRVDAREVRGIHGRAVEPFEQPNQPAGGDAPVERRVAG